MKTKLPDKPSELIRLALSDMKAILKNPKFKVRMDVYMEYVNPDDKRCTVCLAGSVMANTLKIKPSRKRQFGHSPADFEDADEDTYRKLRAINALRNGSASYAFEILKLSGKEKAKKLIRNIKYNYPENALQRKNFINEMEIFANDLQAAGF